MIEEMGKAGIDHYISLEEEDDSTWGWKGQKPEHLFQAVGKLMRKSIESS